MFWRRPKQVVEDATRPSDELEAYALELQQLAEKVCDTARRLQEQERRNVAARRGQ